MLDPVIHKMITYVQNLEEKDLKDKVVTRSLLTNPHGATASLMEILSR